MNVLPLWPGYEENHQLITGMKGSGPANYGYQMDSCGIHKSFQQHKYNNQELVHFTSLNNCEAILRSNTLRFYDLHHMKEEDSSEFSLLANNFDLSRDRIENSKSKIFISSMCDPKILSGLNCNRHWEKYANKGTGCAILFEFDGLNAESCADVAALRIDYKEHNLTQFIDAFRLLEDISNKHFEVEKFLLTMAGLYKNGSKYEWEDEVRLIHIYNDGCSLNWELHYSDRSVEKLAPYHPKDINDPQTSFYYQKSLLDPGKFTGQLPIRIKKVFLGPKFDGDIDSMRSMFDPIEIFEWSLLEN